jgi:hypothetical protein
MQKYLFSLLFVFAIILSGCVRSTTPPITGCTLEAKVCPDGSAVGRTGPNCEFAPCPIATTTTPEVLTPTSKLVEPTKNFVQRVTKKPFGILIDKKTSPVQPERFSGYHTGADAEYADVKTDVPVVAIADGTVEYANTVDGYGGVIAVTYVPPPSFRKTRPSRLANKSAFWVQGTHQKQTASVVTYTSVYLLGPTRY